MPAQAAIERIGRQRGAAGRGRAAGAAAAAPPPPRPPAPIIEGPSDFEPQPSRQASGNQPTNVIKGEWG